MKNFCFSFLLSLMIGCSSVEMIQMAKEQPKTAPVEELHVDHSHTEDHHNHHPHEENLIVEGVSIDQFIENHIQTKKGAPLKREERTVDLKLEQKVASNTKLQGEPTKKVIQQEVVTKASGIKRKAKTNSKQLKLSYKDKHYRFWKDYFGKKEKERFSRFIENGSRFEKIVRSVFRKHNLPEDLYYVGMIESGYQTHARSHASAVGPWQFIRGTAKRYGLKVNRQIDERKNIYKSTEAAAKYFKDLYNIFGSWELALCSYNAGEYRVINAIRKGNTRSYKELVRKGLLPRETIYYVPKVAVAMELAKSKLFKKYANSKEKAFYDQGELVSFKGRVDGKALAKKLSLSYNDFRRYNADWKLRHIQGRYSLVAPKRSIKKISSFLRTIPKSSSKKKSVAHYHKVRRGENLSVISRKYGMSVRGLQKLNRLRGHKIRIGQRLKVKAQRYQYYTVKRGDSLYRIARKYKTSVRNLLSMNDIRGKNIYPNQRLIVSN